MQCLSLAVLAGVTHTHSSQLNLLRGIPSRTQAAQGDGEVMETEEERDNVSSLSFIHSATEHFANSFKRQKTPNYWLRLQGCT